jgi:hypothetical protein
VTLSLFPDRVEPTPGEDVAYTPPSRAAAIVRALLPDLGANPLVCDPHAGGGAFLRAFRDAGLSYRAREIDPAAVRLLHAQDLDCEEGDFLDMVRPRCDLSFIGNPPFSLAVEHLLFALSWRPRMVAWILPAGFGSRIGHPLAVFETEGYGCPVICPMEGRDAYGGPGRSADRSGQTDTALHVWSRKDPLTPRFEPRRIPLR